MTLSSNFSPATYVIIIPNNPGTNKDIQGHTAGAIMIEPAIANANVHIENIVTIQVRERHFDITFVSILTPIL